MKNKGRIWRYIAYIGAMNCPRCGIAGRVELGYTLGWFCYKIRHEEHFHGDGKTLHLIYKTCYYGFRNP